MKIVIILYSSVGQSVRLLTARSAVRPRLEELLLHDHHSLSTTTTEDGRMIMHDKKSSTLMVLNSTNFRALNLRPLGKSTFL
eukprot:6208154-Pleurochrysis_carterae.AAC.3